MCANFVNSLIDQAVADFDRKVSPGHTFGRNPGLVVREMLSIIPDIPQFTRIRFQLAFVVRLACAQEPERLTETFWGPTGDFLPAQFCEIREPWVEQLRVVFENL